MVPVLLFIHCVNKDSRLILVLRNCLLIKGALTTRDKAYVHHVLPTTNLYTETIAMVDLHIPVERNTNTLISQYRTKSATSSAHKASQAP